MMKDELISRLVWEAEKEAPLNLFRYLFFLIFFILLRL